MIGYSASAARCPLGYPVLDRLGQTVDSHHTHAAAAYAAQLLNDGAKLNPHATLGCRVEP